MQPLRKLLNLPYSQKNKDMDINKQPIKQYLAITEAGLTDFNNSVNKLIAEGWQPLGGVSATVTHIVQGTKNALFQEYTQAFVKY